MNGGEGSIRIVHQHTRGLFRKRTVECASMVCRKCGAHFMLADCTRRAIPMFVAALTVSVSESYCAGCDRHEGEALHRACGSCGYLWIELTRAAPCPG